MSKQAKSMNQDSCSDSVWIYLRKHNTLNATGFGRKLDYLREKINVLSKSELRTLSEFIFCAGNGAERTTVKKDFIDVCRAVCSIHS